MSITPNLTLTVSPETVAPGETLTFTVWLDIPPECGDIMPRTDTVLVGDNCIDIFDVVTLARFYGEKAEEDPLADLNRDGVIDFFDLVRVALFFGETSNNKTVEIQKFNPETGLWETILTLTTGWGRRYSDGKHQEMAGMAVGQWTVPLRTPIPSTLYFRAYFPGGIY